MLGSNFCICSHATARYIRDQTLTRQARGGQNQVAADKRVKSNHAGDRTSRIIGAMKGMQDTWTEQKIRVENNIEARLTNCSAQRHKMYMDRKTRQASATSTILQNLQSTQMHKMTQKQMQELGGTNQRGKTYLQRRVLGSK